MSMRRSTDAPPLSIAPDTNSIDDEWGGKARATEAEAGTQRSTAVPPELYEDYARKMTSGYLTDPDTRKALKGDRTSDLMREAGLLDEPVTAGHDSLDSDDEHDTSLGSFGRSSSSIPLAVRGDDQGYPSELPTRPQLDPLSTRSSSSGAPATPHGPVDEDSLWNGIRFSSRPSPALAQHSPIPHAPQWKAEAPTADQPALQTLVNATRASLPTWGSEVPTADDIGVGLDTIRAPSDQPDVIIESKDSLCLSLDDVPPAPFEQPLERAPSTKPVGTDAASESDLLLDSGDALALVNARAASMPPKANDPLADLRDRYAVGDFTGAHEIAEEVLKKDPSNAEALRFRESCKDILAQMYTARIGAPTQVPRIVVANQDLQWLTLDHRAGFLLSCIDGSMTVEEILDVSGMPSLDALRILYTLLQQQVIELSPR